jgi:hypothetical protein
MDFYRKICQKIRAVVNWPLLFFMPRIMRMTLLEF